MLSSIPYHQKGTNAQGFDTADDHHARSAMVGISNPHRYRTGNTFRGLFQGMGKNYIHPNQFFRTLYFTLQESPGNKLFHFWDRTDPIKGITVNRGTLALPNPSPITTDLLATVFLSRLGSTALPAPGDASWFVMNAPGGR